MNWFKIVSGFAIFLAGVSVTYYLIFYIPQRDEQKRDDEIIKERYEQNIRYEQEKQLNACLLEAEINKTRFWNSECNNNGLGENCSLPIYNADRVDKSLKQDKDYCFKQYNLSL